MMKNILELSELSIGFKEFSFNNISASLKLGTMTALMGVNGAGKSCLLKSIAHLIDLKSGMINLEGKNIQSYSRNELAQIISIVLTEKFHVDYLRVDELIALGRSPFTNWRGELTPKDQTLISKVISQVGIESLQGQLFSELSDGQKQKTLIARALVQDPQLLILDEPTTYLDIPSKIELIKLLKKITRENNISVLLSTHDLDLVQDFVDQIWLMGLDGSFSAGSPDELASAGLFKKHFYFNKTRFE